MPTKLHVFDFDNTIFRSPHDSPENRLKFEAGTGVPWILDHKAAAKYTKELGRKVGMRRGWWGRAETLEPPLVPEPAPPEWFIQDTVSALKASKTDPDAVTLVMTGRHFGLSQKVLRILHDGGVVAVVKKDGKYKCVDEGVKCYFLGDDGPKPVGPKPSETLPWKVWIIKQFLAVNPGIGTLEIWEDRDEHVEKFRELKLGVEVLVNHVR